MFYSKPIQNLILEHPKILDSIVYPLAGQKTYRSIIQQQPYHVIEQRYAIFPLKMGTLTIKGPHLTGEVKKTASVSTQDSTSWDEVNIHANDITLEVKPEVGPAKSWLPAQKLTLSHHWSTPISQLRVGQPVTLIITLEAIGLPGTELPDLNQWRIPNILHQNTLIRTTYNTDHIVGKRIYTITLLPQKPGQLIIPAYELTWWNTQTKQQEIAKISAQTWQVLAPLSPPQTSSGTTNQAANIGWYENPWSWVSLTLAIVNLGSIAYYRRRIQRLACKDTTSSQTSLEN